MTIRPFLRQLTLTALDSASPLLAQAVTSTGGGGDDN